MDATSEFLFVEFANLETLMIERITNEADTPPCGSYLIVAIDGGPVVSREGHNDQLTDYSKERLILMEYQDVVNKPVVMTDAVTSEMMETGCKVLRTSTED